MNGLNQVGVTWEQMLPPISPIYRVVTPEVGVAHHKHEADYPSYLIITTSDEGMRK